jgi:hypothetical protein
MANAPSELEGTLQARTGQAESTIVDDEAKTQPDELRMQIARTRAEMGETIDEIQYRLSPAYMKEQTQEIIRDSITGKVEQMAYETEHAMNNWRDSAMNTVRDNPLPVAMIGIGLGWLLVKGNQDNNGDDYYEERYYPTARAARYSYAAPRGRRGYDAAYENEPGMSEQVRERVDDMADNATDWIDEQVDSAQETAEDFAEEMQDRRDSAMESAGQYRDEAARRARETAYRTRRRTRQQAHRAKRTFWDTLNDNPLAIGVATMAAGALVGLALPGTRQEDELLGATRDQLIDEARTRAEETAQRVQAVAEEAQRAAMTEAKQEAKKQDLPVETVTGESESESASAAEATTRNNPAL